MNVSTSTGNNTKYGAAQTPREHVPSSGTAKVASTSIAKAETEEAANEERNVRDFRLNNKTEEQEMPKVRLCYGLSQATYPEMGLRSLQLHRLRTQVS
jgi:hypothetical protein